MKSVVNGDCRYLLMLAMAFVSGITNMIRFCLGVITGVITYDYLKGGTMLPQLVLLLERFSA